MTLGSTLGVEPGTTDFCTRPESGRGCVAVNELVPGRQVAAPFDGVIVRWSTRLGAATNAQTIRIRVLHRLSSEEFQFVSSGSLEPIPEGAGTYTFAASLPIAAGDEVGLESESGKQITYQAELAETHSVVFSPLGTRPDGSPTGTPVFDNAGLEAAFNFEVLADCDHDGLGDETQDADLPPACKPPVAAPSNAFSLGKPKLNKKKGTAKEPVTRPRPRHPDADRQGSRQPNKDVDSGSHREPVGQVEGEAEEKAEQGWEGGGESHCDLHPDWRHHEQPK